MNDFADELSNKENAPQSCYWGNLNTCRHGSPAPDSQMCANCLSSRQEMHFYSIAKNVNRSNSPTHRTNFHKDENFNR